MSQIDPELLYQVSLKGDSWVISSQCLLTQIHQG